ncbi:MAG: MEDS domain-containing protein [Thaumarchaeota archaeon]|nr:MEDS domain-containing protein [Nitrososphaerota archaeon]
MKDKTNKISNFKFIDDEKFGNHPILMYEGIERGISAQLRYMHNGLTKGEHAVYLTNGDPQGIEDEISDYIDVDTFRKKGLLHMFQIEDSISTSSEDALKHWDDIMKIVESFGTRFRLTRSIINNIEIKKGKELRLSIEKKLHKMISQYNGSILCPYRIFKANDSYEKEWLVDIFHNHSDVIYIPESDEGTSFNADFMI